MQRHITAWLDDRPHESLTAVSICAGQGHDLLGVLSSRHDAARVRATLLEYDARNAAAAVVRAAGWPAVEVRHVDAGQRASYSGLLPADLLLLVGVFGNITDADVRRTIDALPELCAPGATVIWTRSRRRPDLTPDIRRWLVSGGCLERAFHAPDNAEFSVGVHVFNGPRRALRPVGSLFRFR